MTFSAHAVLARFKGDTAQAVEYCHDIMVKYPHLRHEYSGYVAEIAANYREKVMTAHV